MSMHSGAQPGRAVGGLTGFDLFSASKAHGYACRAAGEIRRGDVTHVFDRPAPTIQRVEALLWVQAAVRRASDGRGSVPPGWLN